VPTYQYSCNDCGHFFEIQQSFSDDSLSVCPECEGRLRKVFNAVGVVFKGSGFYRNDSRPKAAAESGASSESGSGNGSSGSDAGKGSGKGKESGSGKKSADTSSGSSSSSAPAPA
jgi:putative FmdB family regulatory protein